MNDHRAEDTTLDREAKLLASLNHPHIATVYGLHEVEGTRFLAMELVDGRVDIWAFGCALYEMLTGRRAFEGRTISDVLAAILTREPDWSALPAGLPRATRRLLARCLDEDARTRLRDIGEARVALSAPAEETIEESAAPERRPVERFALLAIIAVLAAVLAWRLFAPGVDPGEGGGVPSFTLSRLTELPGPERNPSLSPDGKMLLYDSAVGGERAINLTEDSETADGQAVFAPDGERIAFRSERDGGGLFVMGATGESVRRVTDFGFNPAWSPDGRQLAFAIEAVDDPYSRQVASFLWKVDLQDGSTTRLTETDAVQPSWSPDGGRIAFWANTGGQRDVWTVDAACAMWATPVFPPTVRAWR